MKVNQIYALVNAVNKDMWGSTATSVKDLSGLIALGKTLELSDDSTDAFLNKLVDRIGKTVVRTLDLEIDFPSLFMDSFSFGAILQKITVDPFDAISNSDWNVGNEHFSPTFADIHKPSVTVKYFHDSTTFAFMTTIPSTIFFTAFTSESAMNNFIDAIMKSLSDSMVMSLNNMSRIAIANLVGEKLKARNGVINLLTLYNATLSTPISKNDAIYDKGFMKFAGMVIRNYIGYIEEPNTMFNVDGKLRATKRDNAHIFMLRDFASAYTTMYSSDTFHEELSRLPMYNEVNHWQGSNDGSGLPTYANNSKINLKVSSTGDGEDAIVQTGLVCLIADRQSIGVTINKRRVGKFVNNIDDYVNTKTSCTVGWFNDLSENALVFIIDDNNGVTLNHDTLTFASSSADAQSLTATTIPASQTVTWKSSDTTVATVSNGTVTPAGAGTCTITATSVINGVTYTDTCAVTVGTGAKSKTTK